MDNLRKTTLFHSRSFCRHVTLQSPLGEALRDNTKTGWGADYRKTGNPYLYFRQTRFFPPPPGPFAKKESKFHKFKRVFLQRSPRGRARVKDEI